MLLNAIIFILSVGFVAAGIAAIFYRIRWMRAVILAQSNQEIQDKLHDLKKVHKLLLDASPFSVFALDCEFRCVFCNETFAKIQNTTVPELIGKNLHVLFPISEEEQDFFNSSLELMNNDNLHDDVLPFTARDGKRRVGRFLRRRVILSDGSLRLIVEMEDVTHTHQMSAILQNSARQNAFFNMVMSQIPCHVFIKDAQSDFRYCIANKKFIDYYALPSEAVFGHTDFDIFSEKTAAQLRANDEKTCVTPGELHHFNEDISFLQERKEVFRSLKTSFRTEDGHLYLLGVCVDVTDSAKYTMQLQKTQELLDLILSTLPVNIFAKKADDNFRYAIVNRAFAEFVDRPIDDIIGKTDAELFSLKDDAQWFREQDQKTMEQCVKTDMLEHPTDALGHQHHMQTSKRPAIAPDGSRLLLGISMDVTELQERITMEHVNNEILEKAVAEPALPKVLANISHILIEKLQCTHVLFARSEEHGSQLKLFYEECVPGIKSVKDTGLERHEKLWQAHITRMNNRELIVYDDFMKIPEIDLLLKNNPNYPTRSLAAAPVFMDDRLFGILMVSYAKPHIFSDSDRHLLCSMANVIALAAIHEKQEQTTLRINREKRAILDNISIPLWLYDRDGNILQTNKAADERLGNISVDNPTPFRCR